MEALSGVGELIDELVDLAPPLLVEARFQLVYEACISMDLPCHTRRLERRTSHFDYIN